MTKDADKKLRDDLETLAQSLSAGPAETDLAIDAKLAIPLGIQPKGRDIPPRVGIIVPMPGQDVVGQKIWIIMDLTTAARLIHGMQECLLKTMGFAKGEDNPGRTVAKIEIGLAETDAPGD